MTRIRFLDSLLVPITFYELDNISFRVAKKNDPQTGDVLTDILDRIGFNAVCPQWFNSRFKLRHIERQMLKSDALLAAFLIEVCRIAWVKFQSNRAKF